MQKPVLESLIWYKCVSYKAFNFSEPYFSDILPLLIYKKLGKLLSARVHFIIDSS